MKPLTKSDTKSIFSDLPSALDKAGVVDHVMAELNKQIDKLPKGQEPSEAQIRKIVEWTLRNNGFDLLKAAVDMGTTHVFSLVGKTPAPKASA